MGVGGGAWGKLWGFIGSGDLNILNLLIYKDYSNFKC